MNDAYDRVKLCRPIIGPNLVFMNQLQDYDISLHHNQKKGDSLAIPINVVHIKPATSDADKNNTLIVKSIKLMPNSPPIHSQGVQIEVNHINSIIKENSENTSPNNIASSSSASYFRISHSSPSLSSSLTNVNNIGSNNSNCSNNNIICINNNSSNC